MFRANNKLRMTFEGLPKSQNPVITAMKIELNSNSTISIEDEVLTVTFDMETYLRKNFPNINVNVKEAFINTPLLKYKLSDENSVLLIDASMRAVSITDGDYHFNEKYSEVIDEYQKNVSDYLDNFFLTVFNPDLEGHVRMFNEMNTLDKLKLKVFNGKFGLSDIVNAAVLLSAKDGETIIRNSYNTVAENIFRDKHEVTNAIKALILQEVE
jgi:hypothetical protein